MPTIVRRNERSWAIEIISKINSFTDQNDLAIKRAGGENTISTAMRNTMFPDVVLYGDREQSIILQGWEIKMPDVRIEDEAFIKDAQRKAIALNLDSCLIWNFTYAVLYVREKNDTFSIRKQWNETSHIRTRDDVLTYRADWENFLERILLEINEYFLSGEFRNAPLGQVVSDMAIATLIQRNKQSIADGLRSAALRNTPMDAYIDTWWNEVRAEYAMDEDNKYSAYAKTLVLNWANKIIFAHIIKRRQNAAMKINNISYDMTPQEVNDIFNSITHKCDFYNVFTPMRYSETLPSTAWQDFVEFSHFLQSNGIEYLNQEALQNILECSVAASRKSINGQFTTPTELAKLLVNLTVTDRTETILDCCCGTGTITKAAIQIKRTQLSARETIESVWACDKYKYPLQVANISMADADFINIASRIFQHNALNLRVGENITIINPETGEEMVLSLPNFGAVVSNLPFVPFEIIPDDDKAQIMDLPFYGELDRRSDLYCYIASKIADVIKPGGRLGIITSNSWLGTKSGEKFVGVLEQRYNIMQVHISGRGRWFKNADIVTTILILERKASVDRPATDFWLWRYSLEQLAENQEAERTLINSALLSSEIDCNVGKLSRYTHEQIEEIREMKVSYNSLFHDIGWLLEVKDKLIPINEVYCVFRGSRRGWDALFYPRGEHRIENVYLKKVLINARKVTRLTAVADCDAFCCGVSMDELEEFGHFGALEWIRKFSEQRNRVGIPLPDVLRKSGMQWYELRDNEIAEVFTMMNPDQKIFFAKFEMPSFVNQRLIGLRHRVEYDDINLNHALLNSILTTFYVEASGFGRGLGVLDINKDSIANAYMLKPTLVSGEDRERIIRAFDRLNARQIMRVQDELENEERLEFEHIVLKAFGIDEYFDNIKSSLISMMETRAAARQ